MEYGLGRPFEQSHAHQERVLILVLMNLVLGGGIDTAHRAYDLS